MTEAEWLAFAEPLPLLSYFRSSGSPRRLFLFCVACCRAADRNPDELRKRILMAAECFADAADAHALAVATEEVLRAMCYVADGCPALETGRTVELYAQWFVFDEFPDRLVERVGDTAEVAVGASLGGRLLPEAQRIAKVSRLRCEQAALLRDIFGNPFRPVAFSPVWRTDTAVAVARQMYDSRDFGAMPILADALQDAGCEDEDILSHCRDANATHVRGCWVVDLVLGKE